MARAVDAPPDGSDVGDVIRWYRKHHNLTQQDAADLLNTTQSRLSKIEKGSLTLGLDELRLVASRFGIPPERLGVLPDRSADAVPNPRTVSDSPGAPLESQERWRAVRAALNSNRAALGDLAAELYPQAHCIPNTTVLTKPAWLPDAPVELADVQLHWRTDEVPKPSITGQIPESESARPLAADGERYRRYSSALRDLARPRLLDNRISYRLLDVDWADGRGRLDFNYTSYFEVLDIGEAVGHEFAEAWVNAGRKRPSMAGLRLRRHIADPFDLLARPMLPSINTLTIRRDPIDGHRMYLHQRDSKAVAAAGGMFHVIPAGVFQPAALAPQHQANDFSIWRNIQREFSEEFLGNPEHDGNSVEPIDYDEDEPFRSFTEARKSGDFRVYATATVLEPLTLWVELLTVAVIEAPAFDRLFAGMVEVNDEGSAVSTESGQPAVGIPFTSDARERLKAEPLSPISRACIELAWQHRHTLLAG
ncbi:helix-turn-helix domain-containing protein [Prauserella endophytica]|uniref:helix-turn-helix domain-containing protein n=1 Tax=Prauserella endophytica TaxID=1592324 RepID=UPI00197E028E|nr:helix-turn-helix transcriptional regulator [Prauserella endophytica]